MAGNLLHNTAWDQSIPFLPCLATVIMVNVCGFVSAIPTARRHSILLLNSYIEFSMRIRFTSLIVLTVFYLTLAPASWQTFGLVSISVADEKPSEKNGFSKLLKREIKSTFGKAREYIESNPEAKDLDEAHRWLFTTALQHDLESEIIELAKKYSKNPQADATTRSIATQALTFGLAKSGKAKEAVELFQSQLRFARQRNGGALIDYGKQVADELRVAREFAGARKIYEEVSNKFFLNPDVRKLCENKITKLELIDEPAPEINVNDTKGATISLSDLKGKVVLIDFWATFCPPCIAELPNIKQLYSEYHDKGFEIVGISLDEDESIVARFAEQSGMTWPMIVNQQDVEALRKKYHVEKIPSLYIVNRKGQVHQYDVKGSHLRKTIEALIAEDK
jgi:peroxiredoxin